MKRITKNGDAIPVSLGGGGPGLGLGFGLVGVSSPDGLLGRDTGRESMSSPALSLIPANYPHRLSMYADPPDYDITIEQLEEWALARLQVLRAVETAAMKYQREDEVARIVKQTEDKHLPLHSNDSAAAYPLEEERRRDQASHFILRLAYANNAESIRWFVTQESTLLRCRFHNELGRERSEFLRTATGALAPLSMAEKAEIADQLLDSSPSLKDIPAEEFYKVPFELVPDLVGRRAVFLRKGWAYVAKSDCFSIVMTQFRESLELAMEKTARELMLLRDERVLPLLQLVKSANVAANHGDASRGFVDGKISESDIESASVHFPPCMLSLYQHARQDHHLRYGGRQQLGLFLKGIGLSLEDAIVLWQRLFAPKCGDDAFHKNYLYNIRHNYGQEGKRANYGPPSCAKIITGTAPGVGDHHGCPFRHSSGDKLAAMLRDYASPADVHSKLSPDQIQEIVELSRGNHCQMACTRLFEYTRKVPVNSTEPICYPTKFFEASLASLKKSKAR